MKNNFVMFILTHGRPDKVHTYRSLKRQGYSGRIIILIDNEDKSRSDYEKFKGEVIVFDKVAISQTFDEGDNFGDRRSIVYARNACFDIAKQLGIKYFIQLDDDYQDFRYRNDSKNKYCDKTNISNLDGILT